MRAELDAVAFDLDGTLYPNWRFYRRLIPFVVREHRMLRAMGKARDALRDAAQEGRFYDLQARLMAEILEDDPVSIQERTERLIYRGWEPIFKKVKLFDGVVETIQSFRDAGLKIGLLSDFPPERKLQFLGLDGLWDAVLCSERVGRLKPAPEPFLALAEALRVKPERLLYVGNSVAYDIRGAQGVGMKAALIGSARKGDGIADFVFSDYRKLGSFVLS